MIKKIQAEAKRRDISFTMEELTNHTGIKVGTVKSTLKRHTEIDEVTAPQVLGPVRRRVRKGMVAMRYTVTAERGRGQVWVFQCAEYPGAISEGTRLADARRLMPEAIAFVAEVDPENIEIDLRVDLPAAVEEEVTAARRAVHDAAQAQQEAAALSRRAVADLRDEGLTGGDMAEVLGISKQRVSQLVNA